MNPMQSPNTGVGRKLSRLPASSDLSMSSGYTPFRKGQQVKTPLGDGTYQTVTFIGTDADGIATVKTKGGRYKDLWDSNLYRV